MRSKQRSKGESNTSCAYNCYFLGYFPICEIQMALFACLLVDEFPLIGYRREMDGHVYIIPSNIRVIDDHGNIYPHCAPYGTLSELAKTIG